MSISNNYKLSDLRRVTIRSWLSTIISLCQRVRDISPYFAIRSLATELDHEIHELHVNGLCINESHIDVDVDERQQQPHVDLKHSSHTHTPSAADAPPTDIPAALAVGIEVKFLLPVLKPGAEDNGWPHDQRPIPTAPAGEQDDFAALIRRAHESVASTISQHSATPVQQRSVTLHDIEAARRLERDYWDTHWIVKKANSALPTASEKNRGDNYLWIPVEVCSPKQRWNEKDGLESALRSVTAVLRALTEHHRVTVNYTCDVHVHVGRADGRHLDLETLKRLATMLWFSEDAIRSVRNPTSPNYLNVFTWGAEMTRHSRLARLIDPKIVNYQLAQLHHTLSDTMLFSALHQQTPAIHAIWKADSHLKLGRLLSGSVTQHRRLGFNFSCLGEEDERAKNGPRTIEFRVLEGTLDEDIISAWVTICWSLVEVAGEGPHDGRFIKVVKTCLGDLGTDGCDNSTVRGRYDPDARDDAVMQYTKATCIKRSRLRALVIDGLGVGADMYDAFMEALLRKRGT